MAAAMIEPPGAIAVSQDNDHAEDVEVVWDDVREDLRQYLDEIKGTGRFATMRRLEQIVDPQVRLLGINNTPGHDISIPLGSRDALKLIEAAHQAPFGKGEETIVDTSVRK